MHYSILLLKSKTIIRINICTLNTFAHTHNLKKYPFKNKSQIEYSFCGLNENKCLRLLKDFNSRGKN